ncbi:helix-turn-helix transcriptional regulator [Streptomyces griseorubiginosus]|uniref:helix-turn-helix transcriptional regulator n=1 Tax=Streptomyces griseorubiginosus TaxID=67304 RepID=UPI0036E20BD3
MPGVLLERDAELERLRAAVAGVGSGDGGPVQVLGPAGLGKTRLLTAAGALARDAGMRVLSARGSELEREYAFGLVRQLFDRLLLTAPDDERERWLSGPAATAGAALGYGGSLTTPPGEFALLNSLFWLASNIAQDQPLALLVDDLHWADESSLRFLLYLMPRLTGLPLLVVAALRPDEPGGPEQLLNVLLADQQWDVLRPFPLGTEAVAQALTAHFGRPPAPEFTAACHTATGGNPLLLDEVSRAVTGEGLEPDAATAHRVELIGSRAVSRRVAVELGRLSPQATALARAVAALGPGATAQLAGAVADLAMSEVPQCVAHLQAVHLLHVPEPGEDATSSRGARLEFVHPLVRAAVYESTAAFDRSRLHRRAATRLAEEGARAEQIAAHLLQLPPAGDEDVVTALRRAAADAVRTSAPEAALAYLRRALAEPPSDVEGRVGVLTEAGEAGFLADVRSAVQYLDTAAELSGDPVVAGRHAGMREMARLLAFKDADQAVSRLTQAVDALPEEEDDLKRGLEATLMVVALFATGWDGVLERVPRLRRLPVAHTPGARALDTMIAAYDMHRCDPTSTDRARRVAARAPGRAPGTDSAFIQVATSMCLISRDLDEGLEACDALLAEARATGSLLSISAAQTYRGWGWLLRGDLAEATTDLRDALKTAMAVNVSMTRPTTLAWLAEALAEQGRLDEADEVLGQLPAADPLKEVGPFYYSRYAQAVVLAHRGRYEEALAAVLEAGRRYGIYGRCNPAVLPWRSLAATVLRALGREQEARRHAADELRLARAWGAPHAHGRALRVAGLVAPRAESTALLREAVDLLRDTPARLEYARALIDLGADARRGNSRAEARDHLAQGLDLAHRCGAAPLAEHARHELRAAGARPRTSAVSGPESLTPSEARVAELATRGLTNRQIAQELFVTPKTVEVHLSAAYRKLGISRRSQLAASGLPAG